MWGRVVEMSIAVWLALSPFIFRAQGDAAIMWADSFIALGIVTLAALSYWPPLAKAHLLSLLVAIGLIVWGRVSGTPPEPIHQNHIFVGLLLLMIAIIPNHASHPPEVWRDEAKMRTAGEATQEN